MSRRKALCWLGICAMLFCAGCVERRLNILSQPSGASVFLDGKPVGETPCQVPFTFYGTREILLHKKGYKLLAQPKSIWPPVYQIFPLDFVSEFLLPFTLHDDHHFSCKLEAHDEPDPKWRDAIQKRAADLKKEMQEGDAGSAN